MVRSVEEWASYIAQQITGIDTYTLEDVDYGLYLVRDFYFIDSNQRKWEDRLHRVSLKLGLRIDDQDDIYEIACRLFETQEGDTRPIVRE
jgi:hypothetical protein